MAARPEVGALLTDFDLQRTGSGQLLVHRSGTPFTPEETDLLTSATDEDMRAAADELRSRLAGDTVTFVVNRNINVSNVCVVGCAFCGFSGKGGTSARSIGVAE